MMSQKGTKRRRKTKERKRRRKGEDCEIYYKKLGEINVLLSLAELQRLLADVFSSIHLHAC